MHEVLLGTWGDSSCTRGPWVHARRRERRGAECTCVYVRACAPQVATLDNSAAMMSSVDVKCRVCFEPLMELAAHAEHLRKSQLRADIAGTSQQRP